MPSSKANPPSIVYWDANVFLDLLEGTPDKLATIQALASDCLSGKIRIVTSTLSIAEVNKAKEEANNKAPSKKFEDDLKRLWSPLSPFERIECYEGITFAAVGLMRRVIPKGWSLKPADAIHLASAIEIKANEIHTYDKSLHKYSELINIKIRQPYTDQLPLVVHAGIPLLEDRRARRGSKTAIVKPR